VRVAIEKYIVITRLHKPQAQTLPQAELLKKEREAKMILDHNLIPADLCDKLYRDGFRGVWLGGCIERKEGSNIRRSAHSHSKKDNYFGWICMKSAKPERFISNGKLTNLAKHELAHLIAENRTGRSYGRDFCKAALELGYRLQKYEHKSVRNAMGKVRIKAKRQQAKGNI